MASPLKSLYNDIAYNYIVNATGAELVRDTLVFAVEQKRRITLPLEQGIGIGLKKGERLNLVADVMRTGWSKFKYPGNPATLADSYRFSAGMNFVPEKYAAGRGAFVRRINYRLGVSHETGYIRLKGQVISNSSVTAGIGLPVGIGRLSSMVHVSLQVGQMGTFSNGLLRENYYRVNFGFTFCDRWFQKFRYD
jgi:hypothetical protein